MDYTDKLNEMYQDAKCLDPDITKMGFLGNRVFDFTTYVDEFDVILGERMLAVCMAIANKKTFYFINQSDENHLNYIIMCNSPFLKDKLEWGTSIRGAWFDFEKEFQIYYDEFIVKGLDMPDFINQLHKWVSE